MESNFTRGKVKDLVSFYGIDAIPRFILWIKGKHRECFHDSSFGQKNERNTYDLERNISLRIG